MAVLVFASCHLESRHLKGENRREHLQPSSVISIVIESYELRDLRALGALCELWN